jgi:hypothetical protein
MKPCRTASQLLERLDAEFVWRLQEIASLRKAIDRAAGINQNALLRASLPILYAHWEGYVKSAAIEYGSYISTLGIKFSEVKQSFSGLRALAYANQLHSISRRIFTATELLLAFRELDNEKAILNLAPHLWNVGNLNYDLFEQILQFFSLDTSIYSSKKQLIDDVLLRHRNEIAHGSFIQFDSGRFDTLSDEILELMRQFKTDIQNSAASRAYIR